MYPFSDPAGSKAKPALRVWIKKIRDEHFSKSPHPLVDTKEQIGGRPYLRVELDGHKIDLRATIELLSANEEAPIIKEISRLWIIAIVEVVSRATLGYAIAYGTNYDQTDILRAMRHSLLPWKPRKIGIPGLKYRSDDGFPSAIARLANSCWDELWVDNASSHFGDMALSYCERVTGCTVVFGPVATPDDRPFVESFFRILEEAGLHRIPGTTGSSTSDKRRDGRDAELRYHLRDSDVHDIVDVLIARINSSEAPTSSLSRLDILRRMVDKGTIIVRRIPENERERLLRRDIVLPAVIGNLKGRAVVRFQGQPYDNDAIRVSRALIGRNVTIEATSDDLRDIDVSLDDGTILGTMYPPPRWRKTKHGVKTRREAKKLEDTGIFKHVSDIPIAVREELEKRAAKSKSEAAKLARIRNEQGEGTAPRPPAPQPAEFGAPRPTPVEDDRLKAIRELLKDEHELGRE
jgi:hypothetical protein